MMQEFNLQPQDQKLQNLFSSCVAISRIYQTSFSRNVIFSQWSIDVRSGFLSLDARSYPVQILGTQLNHSWLWGYANPSKFPEQLLEESYKTASLIGATLFEGNSPDELTVSNFVNGHALSSIASVKATKPCCYYRCPYNDTLAVYVLVNNLPSAVFTTPKASDIAPVLSELVSGYALNHKILVESTLSKFCRDAIWSNDHFFSAISIDNQKITVQFDTQDRIANINIIPA